MSDRPRVIPVRHGEYLIEVDGRRHVVHIAGDRGDHWLHWNGHVFRRPFDEDVVARPARADAEARHSLTAPMPATVLTVSAVAGVAVKRGDTLVVLEAMKMELPIRAGADAVVRAVRCRSGELVQAGAVLVELE